MMQLVRFRTTTLLVATCAAMAASDHAAAAPDDAVNLLTYATYEDAFNRGNADLALVQFTDDAVVIAGPGCTQQKPCNGKAEIRQGLLGLLISINFAVKVREVSLDGDSMRTKIEVSNNAIRQAGFARLVGGDAIQFRGGKIASLLYRPDPTDEDTARYLKTLPNPYTPSAAAQK